MGIVDLLKGRKKAVDGAADAAVNGQPAPQAPAPAPQPAPEPVVQRDPNAPAEKAMAEMAKKYGLKDGGVIDKELLRRRAAVKQKRGC